jgi:TPR repeat protein
MRFVTAILLLSATSFGQEKPLRERLLDRAQQGDAEAQYDLAKNLETGRIGLKRDMVQAEHWYRAAAEQGDPFAQAGLAILYQFGKGVKADPVEACMWYTLAAAGTRGGDHDSIAEMLANLTQQITPEQRAEAQKRAREWKPKK